MRLLFFHNTLAEYRIGFFNELNKICELTVVFTDYDIGEKIYNHKIDKTKIKFRYEILLGSKKERINHGLKEIDSIKPDWCIIPALDDLYSIDFGKKITSYSHSKGIKVGLFWEKWSWKYSDMPISRLLKELVKRFLVSSIIQKCDKLLAPGIKTAEYFKSCGADVKKIYKIHNASEIQQTNFQNIYRKYNIDENKKLVLYLGRLVFCKGLDNLIHAYASLPEEYRKNHVILACGDGPERMNCEKLKKQYDLDNIIFTGAIHPNERYSYYKQSSVFVLPGRANKGEIDAWGLSLNEALQYGNILISTTSVGAAYELINKNNGVLVEENSIQQLANALLLVDQNKLEEKAKVEDARLFSLYNYESMAKDIVDILDGKGSCICF